jgi:iron complex outermembrane recepter protein
MSSSKASGLVLATGVVLTVQAATAADAPADGEEGLPSVVVTALRRETLLQETPAAITALSGAQLHDANITDISSLPAQVPGLVITTAGAGQNRVALRGIRSAGDGQVGIYFGETPVAGPPGTTSDPGASTSDIRLFDVAGVEVLSGPQGTLYGSGSMGGASKINFNKPVFNRYDAAVDVSTAHTDGARQSYNSNAAVNNRIVSMTARPGRIKRIVPVPLPHPRERTEPLFNEIKHDVLEDFVEVAP